MDEARGRAATIPASGHGRGRSSVRRGAVAIARALARKGKKMREERHRQAGPDGSDSREEKGCGPACGFNGLLTGLRPKELGGLAKDQGAPANSAMSSRTSSRLLAARKGPKRIRGSFSYFPL